MRVIDQRFLESDHSDMEYDSMHSALEQEKKTKSVYRMSG
jgi:hypothetical protein